ncbi:hypothetical protein LWC35_29005 [Pseudonocardia kujensis]|uniref:hypothetical protein n=1 Tax=Pseudonocardia kujensis TaxID=1128675 RepID=UPI001E568DE3|nr:hypothetical protein [Pseudonocardia kujensis]MCE0766915.1 hypothetical protein [Pseudonocardia kujensis]
MAARLPAATAGRTVVAGAFRHPRLALTDLTEPVAFRPAARTPHGRATWWCPGCQR